jgi:predicted DNA-binding protein
MYKSVTISEETYKQLNKIATQLNKPKAQVVESLVKGYDEAMRERGKAKLDKFNMEMGAKVKALKFSKEIKVNTDNIDDDFAVLANTDYGK